MSSYCHHILSSHTVLLCQDVIILSPVGVGSPEDESAVIILQQQQGEGWAEVLQAVHWTLGVGETIFRCASISRSADR